MFVCYLLLSRIQNTVTEYTVVYPFYSRFCCCLFCLCWMVEYFRCSISLSKARSFGTDSAQLLLFVSIMFGMMKSHTQRDNILNSNTNTNVHCLFTPNIRINFIIFHSLRWLFIYCRSIQSCVDVCLFRRA